MNALSFSTSCWEEVAGLIPYEDNLAVISHSTKCSEGVADLVSDSFFWGFWFVGLFGFWFVDLGVWFAILSFWFSVSDSRCFVSDSCILVSDSWDFGFWLADFSFWFAGFSLWFFVSDSREVSDSSLFLKRMECHWILAGLYELVVCKKTAPILLRRSARSKCQKCVLVCPSSLDCLPTRPAKQSREACAGIHLPSFHQ